MLHNRFYTITICVLMVTTGSLNTLCAKWADNFKVDGEHFDHPFLQAFCMFIGELLCMGAYLIILGVRKYRWNRTKHDVDSESEPQIPRFNPLLFLIPAISDIISTSVMYIGLTLTSASSYQMLRGALIVCTGLLSIFCLHSTIKAYQWMGMISVVLGLADPIHAWHQICKQPMIAVALTGTTISIAFFNFAGTTVTKNLSATTRTVLDSVRTIVIWAASLPLFGQKFIPLQLIGFALLIFGMFVYNDILIGPWFRQHILPRIYDIPCFGP
ncbi:unnamed protein product [Nippostrongylus brasiliensis]|uniref:Solute carrier family 35 member F6 (inferred by orthology to a human protein) n=1 Tax=Nippostrongylus brasiliensis TaxID=27835 RepID=A0A0N4YDZ6_NIPBR|nr:unnamed protein product [Nippostrongylus brasiliensis]